MWRAPINGSLIWKRSIVGVEMTFGCHCCPLIKTPLTEGGRAWCNILQLRLHSTLSTPRAPGVVLLKDTICTLFPVSSFWRSLLKLDKISLLSHASIQVFQHAFLVNQRRTCDLRGRAFFFGQSQPSLACTAVTFHTACWFEFTSETFKGDAAQFPGTFPF